MLKIAPDLSYYELKEENCVKRIEKLSDWRLNSEET